MTERTMTPQQAIKYIILADIYHSDGMVIDTDVTGDVVDAAYDAAVAEDRHWDADYQRQRAIVSRFRDWLADNCIILDTETTGLQDDDEIVEISLLTASGVVLLDTLVKPIKPIPDDVIRIHGITNEMVSDAPQWPDIYDQVNQILMGKTVVIYNADFDVRLLRQTTEKWQIAGPLESALLGVQCAKRNYAEFWGALDERRGGYRWQRLADAVRQQGVAVDGVAHRALCDVQTTLNVIRSVVLSWEDGHDA